MHAHDHAVAVEFMNADARFLSVFIGIKKLRLALADLHIHRLINIAVRMTGDDDGLFPRGDIGRYAVEQNGRAEHRAVQRGADRAVGTFPHLFQPVFFHALGVGRNGGAFDRHAVFFSGFGGIEGNFIVRFVAMFQPQIVIFRL